jgi:hypothetical protein
LTTASTWTAEAMTIITGNDNIAEKIRETHPDRNVHRLAKTEKKVFWFFPSFFSFFFFYYYSLKGAWHLFIYFLFTAQPSFVRRTQPVQLSAMYVPRRARRSRRRRPS